MVSQLHFAIISMIGKQIAKAKPTTEAKVHFADATVIITMTLEITCNSNSKNYECCLKVIITMGIMSVV
jgi:hypothetical protein